MFCGTCMDLEMFKTSPSPLSWTLEFDSDTIIQAGQDTTNMDREIKFREQKNESVNSMKLFGIGIQNFRMNDFSGVLIPKE